MIRRYKEWAVVTLCAIIVMIASVTITFLAANPVGPEDERTVFERLTGAEPRTSVPTEMSLQIAYETCRVRINRDVRDDLQSMNFDNRASRYIGQERLYEIFVNVHLKSSAESYYTRCNVSAVTGQIEEFRLRSDGGLMFRLF